MCPPGQEMGLANAAGFFDVTAKPEGIFARNGAF
jgi:hypothetical protein